MIIEMTCPRCGACMHMDGICPLCGYDDSTGGREYRRTPLVIDETPLCTTPTMTASAIMAERNNESAAELEREQRQAFILAELAEEERIREQRKRERLNARERARKADLERKIAQLVSEYADNKSASHDDGQFSL